MHAKDHYEMREYNMDVIPDGNASYASGTERPYPIYPSKGGINPNILKNIISRFVYRTSSKLITYIIVHSFLW